jgi:CubicO group peptidase (beta-lactamase class C family)
MGEMDGIHVDPRALDDAVAAAAFTGVATVEVGERRVLQRCEGYLHRAHRVPMIAGARIAIASGNKTFTALAAMRLVGRARCGSTNRCALSSAMTCPSSTTP